MNVGMRVTVDDKKVTMYLQAIAIRGMKPPLKRIAVVGVKSVLRNFHEGGRPVKWAPLARGDNGKGPTRAERPGGRGAAKGARKPRSDKPLIDKGHLMRSVHPEYLGLSNVKICSLHPVAAFHQYGTGIHGEKGVKYWIAPKDKKALRFMTGGGAIAFSKGHWHPGVVARPFMGWQDEDVKEIQRILLNHLQGGK